MREGWTRTTIGDVCEVNPPGTLPEVFSYIDIASVSWERGIDASKVSNVASESAPGRAKRVVRADDVIVATVRPNLRAMALVPDTLDGHVASTGFAVLRARPELALPGLVWAYVTLSSTTNALVRRCTGTNYPAVRPDDIAQLSVALPPLEEQRRIVDLLGALDRTTESVRRVGVASEVVATSLVEDALARGDHWAKTSMGDALEIARGGSPRPIENYLTSDPAGINWIKIGDVAAGDKYITGTAEKIRPEGASRSRRVEPGDFILSNSMSFGRPYIMSISGCIHDGWLLLRDNVGSFDQSFLYWLLRSRRVQKEFRARAAGSGVRNLNISVVSSVELPLPPIREQRAIAQMADAAARTGRQAQVHAAALDSTRRSLVRDLLSGAHAIPGTYDRLLSAA